MKEYGGEHLFLYLKAYDLFVYHATTSQDLKEQIFKSISFCVTIKLISSMFVRNLIDRLLFHLFLKQEFMYEI